MATDLFRPRPDLIDDELFIETRQTQAATAALWRILALSRQEPQHWMPLVVLCGAHGSGTTTLARRFARAAQRSVACDLVAAKLAGLEVEQARNAAAARAQAFAWADDMLNNHGVCQAFCRPAAWLPEHLLAKALEEAQSCRPTITLEMWPKPDRMRRCVGPTQWESPGNRTAHPTRRTSVAFVDQADRLLSVPPGRRRACVDRIASDASSAAGHQVTPVLVGTPELAACVAEFSTTQVVRLDPMDDDAFAAVVAMVFGTHDPGEVAALRTATQGLMGPLLHVARLRGLAPPYHVRHDEILALPTLPAPE